MAITASGFFVQTFVDELDVTNVGLDLTVVTHRLALLSDAATPNFDTHKSWSDLSANEVVGGANWPAGGRLFSTAAAGGTSLAPTLDISPSGTWRWDWNDVAVSGVTIANAMAAVAYADALVTPTPDALLLLIDFITAVSTNNGTFGLLFPSTGVGTNDMTP